jgi:hypothetical protein
MICNLDQMTTEAICSIDPLRLSPRFFNILIVAFVWLDQRMESGTPASDTA